MAAALIPKLAHRSLSHSAARDATRISSRPLRASEEESRTPGRVDGLVAANVERDEQPGVRPINGQSLAPAVPSSFPPSPYPKNQTHCPQASLQLLGLRGSRAGRQRGGSGDGGRRGGKGEKGESVPEGDPGGLGALLGDWDRHEIGHEGASGGLWERKKERQVGTCSSSSRHHRLFWKHAVPDPIWLTPLALPKRNDPPGKRLARRLCCSLLVLLDTVLSRPTLLTSATQLCLLSNSSRGIHLGLGVHLGPRRSRYLEDPGEGMRSAWRLLVHPATPTSARDLNEVGVAGTAV